MIEGIHCDSIVVLANSSGIKIKNLIDNRGSFVNSIDPRLLSECPGYLQRCIVVGDIVKYLRIDLEGGGRFLISPGYRILNSQNELVRADSLTRGSKLYLGNPRKLVPQYDQRTLKEFDRESFIDSQRIDEANLEFKTSTLVTKVIKVINIVEVNSNPIPFYSLTVPRFHNYGIKVGSNVIYVHS